MKRMEVTEKVIGENTFYIRPFSAFVAANISGELSAVLAPVLGSLGPLLGDTNLGSAAQQLEPEFSKDKTAADVMGMDIEKIMPVMASAFSNVSGDKFEHLMKRLLVDNQNISVEGEGTDGSVKILSKDLADEIFCGEIQDMFILCFEVIKVNFGGFFKKLAGQFGSQPTGTSTATPNTASMASST